jgi:multidrug efflux pump subunit AcrA (membrane-fusion protein)
MLKLRITISVLLVLVIGAAAGVAAWWLLSHRRAAARREPQRVIPRVAAPPLVGRVGEPVRIVGYGSARPRIELDISPEVAGIVVEKAPNFLSGKTVRRGQTLLRIDETDYRLALEMADKRIGQLEAQLGRLAQEEKNLEQARRIEAERQQVAQRTLERYLGLLAKDAASENQIDETREKLLARRAQLQGIVNQLALIGPQRAQLEAEKASAEVERRQARVNLERCTIASPVTGRVLSCDAEVGERVQGGSVCGRLYGTDVMEVPVSVPAADLAWIEAARLEACRRKETIGPEERIEARIEWQAPGNGKTLAWSGCVERLEAGLEAETRTATLVVCTRNPQAKVDPAASGDDARAGGGAAEPNEDRPALDVNMFCKVTVLGKRLAKVYVLPREAVLPDQSVYLVEEVAPAERSAEGGGAKRTILLGRLRKRPVRVARFTSDEAMILPGGGLADGDHVVVSRVAKPVLGMQVEVSDSAADMPTGGGPAAAAPSASRVGSPVSAESP